MAGTCTNPKVISPFVNALLNPNPSCKSVADINADGLVDARDITPFIALLGL
jgi:hypothetical protein